MNKPSVIIDSGSDTIKAGFSGEQAPESIFPSVITTLLSNKEAKVIKNNQDYIGEKVIHKSKTSEFKYPIKRGFINDWQAMTKVWKYCYQNQLKISSSQHPCFLTEPFGNLKQNRQRTTEIVFEALEVPSFYIENTSTLTLYGSGRTTGLVLQSGHGVTSVVPIFQDYYLHHAFEKNYLAGLDIAQYLKQLLNRKGICLDSISQAQVLKDIVQQCCYVAPDFQAQLKKNANESMSKNYKLPDGNNINISNEAFQCTQSFFNPNIIEKQLLGLHQLVYNSILKSDRDIRRQLFRNIVIGGGCTMLPGFAQRLNKQIEKLAYPSVLVKVHKNTEKRFAAWVGGSVLSSLSTFQQLCITKAQYQESGSSIVHRRCN